MTTFAPALPASLARAFVLVDVPFAAAADYARAVEQVEPSTGPGFYL